MPPVFPITFELTIDGTQYSPKAGSLHIAEQENGRATASFSIISLDRSFRPPLDGEVIIEEDGTRIFAGLIERPLERGLARGTHPAIVTDVSVVDFNAYTDWRLVNETFPAQTLKERLTTLATYLSVYGVTLHASQVDGPNLPEVTYRYVPVTEVLNQAMTLTAEGSVEPYTWRIDFFKVLRAFQPSTQTAPFDLVGNELPEVIGDIEVEETNADYANKIIVVIPTRTETNRIEEFTATAGQDEFELWFSVTSHPGVITVTDSDGTRQETISEDSGSDWLLTRTPLTDEQDTITRNLGGLEASATVAFTFDGFIYGEFIATDGVAHTARPRERVIVNEAIDSVAAGESFAWSELAKRLPPTRTIRYNTFEQGLVPGQSQTVTVSARNLSATAVISEIVTRDFGKDRLIRQVTAIVDDAQTNLHRGWRETYEIWAGDKTGAGGVVTATKGEGEAQVTGPAQPFLSVQFNRSGSFGGDAAFIYYEDQNSIVCGGGGNSITAADFESCQVFGNNCHIADPS